MSQRRILNLAILGLPPDWDSRYVPALERLEGRVRIANVYDSRVIRAEQAAALHAGRAARGVCAALQTGRMDAVLLLDNSWQIGWTLQIAAACGLPCFVGQHVLRALPDWQLLQQGNSASKAAAEIVPECRLRYQPALLRLRELMATGLGRAQHVRIHMDRARRHVNAELALREVVNWLSTSFEVGAAGPSLDDVRHTDDVPIVTLFAGAKAEHRDQLEIELVAPQAEADVAEEPEDEPAAEEPFCEVRCEKGRATLSGPRQLEWEVDGHLTTEELAEDRSASAVALDLFARRAVGGLIPVPALADLARAQRLADQIVARL